MSIEERNDSDSPRPGESEADDDQTLATLMSLAGRRHDIPELVERRVRNNVQDEWRRATAMRRGLRWAVPVGLAAAILLTWTITLRPVEVSAPTPVGTIAKVIDRGGDLSPGDEVYLGDRLTTTSAGGLSFDLANNTSVRIARDSLLRIDGEDEFTLLAGAVYVDTGESVYRDQQVLVVTDFGRVTDVGTQFAVSLDQQAMQVAVREGSVDIDAGREPVSADAGSRVTIMADAAPIRSSISAVDDDWDWAEELAPGFEMEGSSVLDFLKWVSRETGLELEFTVDADRFAAMSSELHGSIGDLTPMEALVSVMSTTAFDYVIDGDAISVRR